MLLLFKVIGRGQSRLLLARSNAGPAHFIDKMKVLVLIQSMMAFILLVVH